MFLGEVSQEFFEAPRRFFRQDDSLRKQTMAGAVAGGVAFSLFGDGALGAGSVGAGGVDLFFSWHKRPDWLLAAG